MSLKRPVMLPLQPQRLLVVLRGNLLSNQLRLRNLCVGICPK